MATSKSVKYNFFMNALLSMSSFIFPLITFPYVSRILLPDGTGKVSFATSVITYFGMVAQLGIPTYGIRACARVRDDKKNLSQVAQELLVINGLNLCVVYTLFLVSLYCVPKFEHDKELLLVISASMIFNMIGAEWLYKSLEQYSYITYRSIIFKFLAVILMFLFVQKREDYIVYGAITVLASVGSGILNFINIRKYIFLRKLEKYNLKRHIKPILVFFSMTVASTIYTNLDTVMLGFMQGDEQVGYYNAAVKIKNILVSLVTSLGTVLLPRLSYYIDKKMEKEFRTITTKALNFVILLALPVSIYFILFAEDSIMFLSGSMYSGAIMPMKIIMPTVLLIGITNISGIQVLIPIGREKQVLISVVAGAITDLILNIFLIPRYAASGAAIGTLVAEFVVLVVQMKMLGEFFISLIKSVNIFKIICSLGVAITVVVGVNKICFSSCFFKLVCTSMSFFGVYGIMLLVMKEPLIISILKDVISKYHKN